MNNMNNRYILVTGGLGYIGSQVVILLLEKSYNVIILDMLVNSNLTILDKIKKLAHILDNDNRLVFVKGDIRDTSILEMLFTSYTIDTVMHFAALKSVNESQLYPELYNDVNVIGTKILLNIMNKFNCTNFIYSSSAVVYGNSAPPVTETTSTGQNILCNYGLNKHEVEQYLIENSKTDKMFQHWKIIILRYFNPIGAHPSGLLGEDPNEIPNNIFPYLLRVARWTNVPEFKETTGGDMSPYNIFTIYGNDYDTPDGTCIRDFIHIQDLARAHVVAHDKILLDKTHNLMSNLHIYNVGTGHGISVLELVTALNEILIKKCMKPINYKIGARRDADIMVSYANSDKIYEEIGFKTHYDVYKMCEDGLNFVDV